MPRTAQCVMGNRDSKKRTAKGDPDERINVTRTQIPAILRTE